MSQPRLRKPRFERCTASPPLLLTGRDIHILALADRYRLIRSDHLCRLVPGSTQHLTRRLGRLFHAGYLERPRDQLRQSRCINAHLAYSLAPKGQRALRARGIHTFVAVPRFRATAALSVAHGLRVADVLAVFESIAPSEGLRFLPHHEWQRCGTDSSSRHLQQLRWSTRLPHGGHALMTSLIPDAAFALESLSGGRSYFLLELDRGTMPVVRSDIAQSSIQRKVLAYKATRQHGVLWKRFQVPGFRVLIVSESRRRMASLQAATAATFRRGESSMFLFATTRDLLAAPRLLEHPWLSCSGTSAPLLAPAATSHGKIDREEEATPAVALGGSFCLKPKP